MKTVYLGKLVLVTMMSVLAACQTIPKPIGSAKAAQDGCKMSFKTAGGWSISGINIPTTKLPTGSTVKIGNVVYNADQAYELTESAQALEQARLLSCALINSPAFISMSDTYKSTGFATAFAAVTSMTTFGTKVRDAAAPAEGLAAAEQAKKEALSAAEKAAAEAAKKPLVSLDMRLDSLSQSTLTASKDASHALQAIEKLRTDVDGWRAAPQSSRIEIVGFPSGATDLSLAAREAMFAKVSLALSVLPPKQDALLLVVGYADAPGALRYNVELGLRRAQNVIDILQRQPFERTFQSRASSGGVDRSASGRHVKIFVLSHA